MTDLSARIAAFFDELLVLDPVSATSIGEHRYDERWPDMTDAGRAERLAFADRWLAELGSIDPATLSVDDAADRDVLVGQLDAARFQDTVLLEERWDPLAWVYLLGGGLFPLLSREFAPAGDAARVGGRPARDHTGRPRRGPGAARRYGPATGIAVPCRDRGPPDRRHRGARR